MKILKNLEKKTVDFDGKELEGASKISDYLSAALFYANESRDAVKSYKLSLKIKDAKEIVIEDIELTMLEDAIRSAKLVAGIKAQLQEYLSNAQEYKPKENK